MYLKNRIEKLERAGGHGGRKLVVMVGNELTSWAVLEKKYLEEYDRNPADDDLLIRIIDRFGCSEHDPGRILEVLDMPE